jgi:hypothetical protein
MVYQVNFELKRGSDDLSPYVISYEREHKVCSGTGSFSVNLSPNLPYDIIQGNQLNLKEDGTTVAKYYVETKERTDRELVTTLRAVDGAKWLRDYFIAEVLETDIDHYAKYWAKKILDKAKISYNFQTPNDGVKMEAVMTLGLQSAYDSLTTICQQNGWFFYFNSSGTCIIDNITFQPSGFSDTFGTTDVLEISTQINDERVRNRAVIWGGTDINNNEWIFTDRFVKTPWTRNKHDKRTVMVSNAAIGTKTIANEMAKKLLDEYQYPEHKKVIEVHGFKNISLGQGIRVKHDYYSGVGMVTSYKVTASNNGARTQVTLDERCPRLFAYFRPWDFWPWDFPPYTPYYFGEYIYIATHGNGIKRKTLEGSTWVDFSAGLGGLYVRDLYISYGVMVCIVSTLEDGEGVVYTRNVGDTSWTLFNPRDIEDVTEPFAGPIASANLDAKACVINQLTNEIEVVYNQVRKARAWHVIVKPFTGGKHVVRQIWSKDVDDETLIYYNWEALDIDTNDFDTFILGIQGGTGYPLTDGTESPGDLTTALVGVPYQTQYSSGSFVHAKTRALGEHTLQGTSKMNVHQWPGVAAGYRYGGFFSYMFDGTWVAVPQYAFSGSANTQKLIRYNIITEKEETVTLISGLTAAQRSDPNESKSEGVQQIAEGQYIYAYHTSADQGSEDAIIKMYDFADGSNTTLFTATGDQNMAGPYVCFTTDKKPKILFFTSEDDGTYVTDINIFIYNVETSTLNKYVKSVSGIWSEDYQRGASNSFYSAGGLFVNFRDIEDFSDTRMYIGFGMSGTSDPDLRGEVIYAITIDDDTIVSVSHETTATNEGVFGHAVYYDQFFDRVYWVQFGGTSPAPAYRLYSTTADLSGGITNVDSDSHPHIFTAANLNMHITGRGRRRQIADGGTSEQLYYLSDGTAGTNLLELDTDNFNMSMTMDSIHPDYHFSGVDDFGGRIYLIEDLVDAEDYYTSAAQFKTVDTPATISQIPYRITAPIGLNTSFSPPQIFGNVVFFYHDNNPIEGSDYLPRILYPDTGDVQLLRTNPNINFETVFFADRENNRDALVGVEISKPNPIIIHGSMTQTDSRIPDRTKGLIYRSDFGNTPNVGLGNPNNWLYNVFNEYGYGHVNAARFFDVFGSATTTAGSGLHIDPTQLKEDPLRYMLLTQFDGRLLYKAHDNFLGNSSLMHTFDDPVGQVETNNYSFGPHIFVATSGATPKFYQRLNTQDQFYEKSSGLPGSRIKKIRVDDYF